MLPFSVTIPATVPQRSEIPEGLMNYPVCTSQGDQYPFYMLYLQVIKKGRQQITWSCLINWKWQKPKRGYTFIQDRIVNYDIKKCDQLIAIIYGIKMKSDARFQVE
jgi:hypothetical protein